MEGPDLQKENEELRGKVRELEETLDAIRSGEVDAIVVSKGDARQVYTLEGADQPYRVLVENIREGALTLSRTGMILYANTRFAEMTKVPPDKVPGTSILDYVCPEYQAAMKGALTQILEQACRTRLRIRQGKGSLPVLISMNPLDHIGDTKISVVITDRRKDENRIRMQARMLDAVGDAVIAADTKNKVIYWNNAAARTYGWTAEEAIGKDLVEVATPEISQAEAREIVKKLKNGETWTGEYMVRHRDGHEFPIYASDAPVLDDDGTLIAIIGASHDITARKQAEEELKRRHADLNEAYEEIASAHEELRRNVEELAIREKQLQEALAEKEILLSEVHHRVKNNLTAFISLLSLEGSYVDTEEGKSLRKDLQNRARSMALIHETLYKTGKFSTVDMEVYLSNLVRQIADSYAGVMTVRTQVGAHGVTLDLSRATTAGLIVNELVTNSFKYAFPKGFDCLAARGEPCTIRVLFIPADGTYKLTVSDNGCGLPAGLDPGSTKTLGLKLVTFLACHQLRADIRFNTENGTEFVFKLNNNDVS